jgi:hypothetical protein
MLRRAGKNLKTKLRLFAAQETTQNNTCSSLLVPHEHSDRNREKQRTFVHIKQNTKKINLFSKPIVLWRLINDQHTRLLVAV